MQRVASRFVVVVLATFLSTAWITATPQSAAAVSPNIVISQVYGGGGNTNATYQSDFIELYNRGSVAVDVSAWSVQYASTGGTNWSRTNLTGSIPPGAHYLVKESTGTSCGGGTTPCGVPLPTPDVTGTIAMAVGAGKVALVSNQATIAAGTSCPTTAVVDLVGYGTGTNCFEGTGPTTPSLTSTTAALRSPRGARTCAPAGARTPSANRWTTGGASSPTSRRPSS